VTGATQPVSTPKLQDESQNNEFDTWLHALGKKMVEAGNRMETDPEFRKNIQRMTH
jgi:hypothetical protein